MNRLQLAQQDRNRLEASSKISREVASKPILLVEGKFDRNLLQTKWQSCRDENRHISVIAPEKGGKTNALTEYNKKYREQVSNFLLIDMDHDFDGSLTQGDRIFDTNPLVTLPSHYFSTEILMREFVLDVLPNEFKDTITENQIESIVRLARVLTWIKLFKGKERIRAESYLLFEWDEIDIELQPEILFHYHIVDLSLHERYSDAFSKFVQSHIKILDACGLNDHMLQS